jgi:hypothetical protein
MDELKGSAPEVHDPGGAHYFIGNQSSPGMLPCAGALACDLEFILSMIVGSKETGNPLFCHDVQKSRRIWIGRECGNSRQINTQNKGDFQFLGFFRYGSQERGYLWDF